MSEPNKRFRVAKFGSAVEHIPNAVGNPLFKPVTITWTKPRIWLRDEAAPQGLADVESGYVYALTRDHGKSLTKPKIVYIGLSTNIKTRFYYHPTAKKIRDMRGKTRISIGCVNFGSHHHEKSTKRAIESLEHLIIWALHPRPTFNKRKSKMMPGMGKYARGAWHIHNRGERFSGKMPLEIVHPWMLVRPGRDHSKRK